MFCEDDKANREKAIDGIRRRMEKGKTVVGLLRYAHGLKFLPQEIIDAASRADMISASCDALRQLLAALDAGGAGAAVTEEAIKTMASALSERLKVYLESVCVPSVKDAIEKAVKSFGGANA